MPNRDQRREFIRACLENAAEALGYAMGQLPGADLAAPEIEAALRAAHTAVETAATAISDESHRQLRAREETDRG